MPHEHVVAGLATALRAGALTADAVALEARKAAEADDEPAAGQPAGSRIAAAATVTSLHRVAAGRTCRPTPGRCPRWPPTTSCCRRRRASGRVTTDEEEAPVTLPRQRGLTEQAADTAVDPACRMLRLPTIRNQFPDIADRPPKDQMTYRGFLAELLMAECDDRARRRSERRIKAAGFPREKSLRTFDFDANPNIDPAAIHTLASCDWVKKGQPLCLIGDSGTGKSHLLIALGTEAAMAGYRVRYIAGHQAGQRAGRGRRREAAGQDHRPLRPRRPSLHRRTRLHGTRPPRRRTAVPGPDRA